MVLKQEHWENVNIVIELKVIFPGSVGIYAKMCNVFGQNFSHKYITWIRDRMLRLPEILIPTLAISIDTANTVIILSALLC